MKRTRINPVSQRRLAAQDVLALPQPHSTFAKRSTPIPAESDRRRADNRVRYGPTRDALYERSRGACEVAGVIGMADFDARLCQGRLEQHEVLTRARGGSITDPANQLLACSFHHAWITSHPAKSVELGLMRNSWDR